MIQIRNNVFETNSSSTHCMVIGKISDFEKWESGELFYLEGWGAESKGFITKEEAITKLKNSRYRDADTDKAIKYLETGKLDESEDDDEYEAKSAIFEELANNDIYEYDYYINNRCEYLESEETDYTTPGGETVRILCHYGYEG